MIKHQNFSLKPYNTFGLDVRAQQFVEVQSETELIAFLGDAANRKNLKLILGGGSNLLLTKNIEGLVLHVNLTGKRLVWEDEKRVIVEAQAGESWHAFVLWAIDRNWGGLENMSLIPGNTGTAPMQNIGAYGVELKDVFESLDAINIETGEKRTFSKDDCAFGYRESVFKHVLKGQYIITAVRLNLNKPPHQVSTKYGAIQGELNQKGITNPTIKQVSDGVIAIRQSKLPDPKKIGNSGSFFKNPILPEAQVKSLQQKYPDLPVYPASKGFLKVAAGWLIDKTGMKGYRDGDAGVHKNQALVLVNYGQATGEDILSVARLVISRVHEKFGIALSPEVNIIS